MTGARVLEDGYASNTQNVQYQFDKVQLYCFSVELITSLLLSSTMRHILLKSSFMRLLLYGGIFLIRALYANVLRQGRKYRVIEHVDNKLI